MNEHESSLKLLLKLEKSLSSAVRLLSSDWPEDADIDEAFIEVLLVHVCLSYALKQKQQSRDVDFPLVFIGERLSRLYPSLMNRIDEVLPPVN